VQNPFAVERWTIQSPLSPADCELRLRDRIGHRFSFASVEEKPLIGSVKPEGFRVRIRSLRRNDMSPVAIGRFEIDPSGTRIPIAFGLPGSSKFLFAALALFAFALGYLRYAGVLHSRRPEGAWTGSPWGVWIGPIIILVSIGLSLTWGSQLARGHRETMFKILTDTFGAAPSESNQPIE
jgi:hypothetical protein